MDFGVGASGVFAPFVGAGCTQTAFCSACTFALSDSASAAMARLSACTACVEPDT